MVTAQDVAAVLAKTGWTQSRLGREIGVTQATVSRWLKGSVPEPSQQERLEALIRSLSIERPDEGLTVPVVGQVRAGAAIERIQASSQGELERVPAPEGANATTVAVEVEGESMGSFFDQWLVFYDEVFDPPQPHMIGKVCVCGLADGRVLIKRLRAGGLPGTWTLLSQFEPPIYDAYVEWAAVVRGMQAR